VKLVQKRKRADKALIENAGYYIGNKLDLVLTEHGFKTAERVYTITLIEPGTLTGTHTLELNEDEALHIASQWLAEIVQHRQREKARKALRSPGARA
jgi:hypothetical protein